MGAESVDQVDDSPVAQIRKPEEVEAALDAALLDMPMKENSGIFNTTDSPDSVLKENSGGISNESADVHNVNGVDAVVDPGLSTSGITKVDQDADAEGKLAASGVTGVATWEVLTPTVGVKEDTDEQDSDIKKSDTLETSIWVVQTSTAKASIAHEIQDMKEISLDKNDGEQKGSFKKAVSATESQPDSKMVENNNNLNSTPRLEDRYVSQPSTRLGYDAVSEPGSGKQEGQAKLTMAEREDALVTTEAPGTIISQPVITENPGAELKIKTEVANANERTERQEKLAVLAIGSLPTSRASEIQEAAEPVTPPTPGRTGTMIRLTRQMSQVSMGISPSAFETRAAKEIQNLQEKVKLMEEESRRKSAVIEMLSLNYKERESELLNEIECLEFANEQLLQGGNDSSIQLQMELTRLQRQNSELQVCKREMQFQINYQEMIQTQMLDKRPATAEATNPVEQLESSKVAVLESKLAEAVEVKDMYKIQLHEALKSSQSAALMNLCDPGEVLKELQKLRKQNKEQGAELEDFQDRYFMISVRLAETAAQKEELLSKLKRMEGLR